MAFFCDLKWKTGEKIVLEDSLNLITVLLLSNDQDRQSSVTPEPNGLRLSPSPLESAIDDISRDARATGEESFELRRAAAIAQREALVQWAEANGLKLDPSLWEDKAPIGGSEHDIWEQEIPIPVDVIALPVSDELQRQLIRLING